ncbi:MAG: hypothetical protein EZS28_003801 [Streblomastix strix]|uniref:SPRY domain-containing protein n=1 Tax=Streblomastix strix TaxID=222440 RepID=A0A5J4X0B1_9EUKA|nr:MAG: hypothetical protein EZS28_003801 [Streblomastix strix]
MAERQSESLRLPGIQDQSNVRPKLSEISFLVDEILSEDPQRCIQCTERLMGIALQGNEQTSGNLFLCALTTILNSDNIEESKVASDALSKIIRNSPNIRELLIKSGFVEMASIYLTDENTPDHIHTNILIVIQDLVFNSADVHAFSSLFGILSQISEDKDKNMKKKSIGLMAKKICAILSSQGITGPSSSDEIQGLKKQNEEQKRQIEIKKRENEELQRNDEELKRNISELQRKDEEKSRKITELERQLADSNSKPNTNIQQVSELQSGEIPISITVPKGSYTKKEGEFTYTSTQAEYKTFPINSSLYKGIYRCEFKVKTVGHLWFGIMKSGLKIPFGQHANSNQQYGKDSMFFYQDGKLFQNGKSTTGNQAIKDNDSVALEVNLNSTPRTVHLFINNVQQPIFMSGVPESVQFFFFIYQIGNSVTVLSLKRLTATSVQIIPGSKEMKWE